MSYGREELNQEYYQLNWEHCDFGYYAYRDVFEHEPHHFELVDMNR